jgi:hypothetical protein
LNDQSIAAVPAIPIKDDLSNYDFARKAAIGWLAFSNWHAWTIGFLNSKGLTYYGEIL